MITFIRAYYRILKDRARKFYRPEFHRAIVKTNEERKKFYAGFLVPGSLVFDVGANLGNRTGPLTELGMKVVAFEPQRDCYAYLAVKYRGKAIIEKKALGRARGQSVIRINSDSSTISSMSDEWISSVQAGRFAGGRWNRTEPVKVETLDNMINRYGQPSFIKIDVEGFESEVLKGLSRPVKMICFEYTLPEQTAKAVECIELICSLAPSYRFNFAAGEENHFALDNWLTGVEITSLIGLNQQKLKGFGDIYAKMTS